MSNSPARRVYELDTDDLMSRIKSSLAEGGYEVVEQIPAGVWWLKTDRSRAEIARQLTELFQRLVVDELHEVS